MELLQTDNYLVGLFQSNVYQLATKLNTAHHIEHYPLSRIQHYSVDIEWFENLYFRERISSMNTSQNHRNAIL